MSRTRVKIGMSVVHIGSRTVGTGNLSQVIELYVRMQFHALAGMFITIVLLPVSGVPVHVYVDSCPDINTCMTRRMRGGGARQPHIPVR